MGNFNADEILEHYCKNEMQVLKRMSDRIISRKNIPQYEWDDLYSDALNVLLESVRSFDSEKNCSFHTYLTNNLKKSFWEWTRNRERGIRCNLERDEKGKIIRDEDGRPNIIHDVSFDVTSEDDLDLSEKIASPYSIDEDVEQRVNIDNRVDYFIQELPKKQREILLMRMDGISAKDIQNKLSLSKGEYNAEMNAIKYNENLSMFTKNKKELYQKENAKMQDTIVTIKDTNQYRTDKWTLYSLLENKKNKLLNCKYILQRKPFQWSNEEVNRYLCRILSDLPIPEIIICEKKTNCISVDYLIDGLQRLSYAEAFKEGIIKIGKAGAERHEVKYREYLKDENGARICDEMDNPTYDVKIFDLIGHGYDDLPEDLKARFNNYNINVTKFFNCSDQQIADHLRDYNNHSSMNKEQAGMTKIKTSVAMKIKSIAENNPFFKNCGNFTNTNRKKGKIDRVVSESIMLLFHKEKWKTNLNGIYQYINENASDNEFEKLSEDLTRLNNIIESVNLKEISEMFTVTTTPMWVAVFHNFLNVGIDDNRFGDFLIAYNKELYNKSVDGVSMDDFKHKQTKQKITILGKIELLTKLMMDYFGIENNAINIEETHSEEIETKDMGADVPGIDGTNEMAQDDELLVIDFVRKHIKNDVTESDIDDYYDMLDGYNIDKHSRLLHFENEPSLIGIVAYSFEHDIDLDNWIVEYFGQHEDYIEDQEKNYFSMKNDLENYCKRKCA